MSIFHLPDLGEGLQEAELVAWHVNVGDHVVADQPLASVETDKAVVEIPSPHSGQIEELHGTIGDIIPVGAPFVTFASDKEDSGTVVGRMPEPKKKTKDASEPEAGTIKHGVRASPAVRNMAQRLEIDLATVSGTGPSGAVTIGDLERAAADAGVVPEQGLETAEPLRGVRRAMAQKMAEAHSEVVPASVMDDADVGAWREDDDVTLRLVRAIASACQTAPALNAWYLGPDKGRILHDRVDLGIAMDTEDGLFVPVLRDVGKREPADIRRGIDAMKRDVQASRVPLKELRGQTITLSNFGMFAGRHAALVVLPPQVAIVGAGRIREAAAARAGNTVATRLLPLSLTFDHRVVMGGEAARFLSALINDLERDR
jgi:pyruvate dehydrogenase E2 component (dihydrolipoamide acetyltransferase)